MMPVHFPYGNPSTARHNVLRTTIYPNPGHDYHQYFASFHQNTNGLLPTPPVPLMMQHIEQKKPLNHHGYKPLMSKNPLVNSSTLPYLLSQEEKKKFDSNNFLTFVKQKSKPISELNPCAHEFSSTKNQKEHNQIVPADTSSYQLIFDDLIEQSLQSIDAIKKASKIACVNHVSTQYNQSTDQINRSTQTNDDNSQYNQLEEYSLRTVTLMNRLLENFKYLSLLSNVKDLHNQLQFLNHICDELRYLILVMNRIIATDKPSIIEDNSFRNTITNLPIQSFPLLYGSGQRSHRLISSSSISHSPAPSFSSRLIDPITINRSKMCLLCQKPVNDSDDFMHKLCRLLSSPPDA